MTEDIDINSLNIKESFLMLTQYMDEDYEDIEEIYQKVRFGINLRFDIYDYINEMIKTKDKNGIVIYRGKNMNLTKFWTELEQRNIIAKKWLKENTIEEGPLNVYEIKNK